MISSRRLTSGVFVPVTQLISIWFPSRSRIFYDRRNLISTILRFAIFRCTSISILHLTAVKIKTTNPANHIVESSCWRNWSTPDVDETVMGKYLKIESIMNCFGKWVEIWTRSKSFKLDTSAYNDTAGGEDSIWWRLKGWRERERKRGRVYVHMRRIQDEILKGDYVGRKKELLDKTQEIGRRFYYKFAFCSFMSPWKSSLENWSSLTFQEKKWEI